MSLVYDLPVSVLNRDGNEIDYRLLIQKQPGARRRDIEVEFILPPGYSLASSSIEPAFEGDSRVSFVVVVDRDKTLEAVFAKEGENAG